MAEEDKVGKIELADKPGKIDLIDKKRGNELTRAIEKVTTRKALTAFNLGYDSPSSQLESVYFWLLDFMDYLGIKDVNKITDNFMSTPGSGHFAEIGQRATRMQEEGIKIMGIINQLVKAILNLVYDLKEFQIRLENYKDAVSPDKQKKEAGILALKQIWLDNVDMKRGRGSIHAMANEIGFTTLREIFLICNSLDDVEKISKEDGIANDQVKRVLLPRIAEFLKWQEFSEKELKKRFNVEKAYLKSQVETLKLYTKWARPYLKAAEELRQKGFERNPAMVSAFNTAMFDLVLIGKTKIDFEGLVRSGDLPKGLSGYKLKRDYYSCYVLGFIFRGLPQKVTQQHYGFGGRADVTFDSYILNSDEIKAVNAELESQDLEDGIKVLEETTQVSLEELKEDITSFLGEDEKEVEKTEKKSDDINPFSALLEIFKLKKSKEKDKKVKGIKKDNYVEKLLRKAAEKSTKRTSYLLYDIYKKAHGMASSPQDFDY